MLAPFPGGSEPPCEENPESNSGLIQSSSFSLGRLNLLVIAGNTDLADAVDTAASRGAPTVRAHAQHAVTVRILLGTGDRDPMHQPAENRAIFLDQFGWDSTDFVAFVLSYKFSLVMLKA